jgi:acetyl-CoA acetyltransferase
MSIRRDATKPGTVTARDKACVVGVGMTPISRDSGKSTLQMAVDAALAALDDAGLQVHDLDAVVTYQLGDSVLGLDVAAALGVPLIRYYAELHMGGPAATLGIATAALAIAGGSANNVLVFRSMNGRTGARMGRYGGDAGAGDYRQWILPYGFTGPPQVYAMWARRHMHEYGTTSKQLGQVAVTLRENAQLNPAAYFHGKPITLEDHQSSRMVSSPFRLLDCCLENDVAAAVIVSRADRASSCAHPPVYIGGFAGGAGPAPAMPSLEWPDFTNMYGAYLANDAFAMAGLERSDVDVALLYDAFTYAVISHLEDLGFVGRGEGGPFVEDGNIALGGALPVNPNGGLLSEGYVHGMNNFIEAVRQLRGQAGARQVAGAEVAVVTGSEGPRGGVILLHA